MKPEMKIVSIDTISRIPLAWFDDERVFDPGASGRSTIGVNFSGAPALCRRAAASFAQKSNKEQAA